MRPLRLATASLLVAFLHAASASAQGRTPEPVEPEVRWSHDTHG